MEVKNKKIKGAAAFVGTLLTKPVYLSSKFTLLLQYLSLLFPEKGRHDFWVSSRHRKFFFFLPENTFA